MKVAQVARVFQLLKIRTGKEAPYRVGVMMLDGQRFAGSAFAVDASNNLMKLEVDRIADAHLTKPPETIWLDAEAIQAITDNEGILVEPLVAEMQERALQARQAGETAETEPETHEGHEDHEPEVQSVYRDQSRDAAVASGTAELPQPVQGPRDGG